jgi:hypothetical protein
VALAVLTLVAGAWVGACGGDRSLTVSRGAAGTSAAGAGAAGSGGGAAGHTGPSGSAGATGVSGGAGAGGSTGTSGDGGNPSDPCAAGRARYDDLRAQFLAKSDGSFCKADSDCSIVDLENRCDNQCGGTAIFKALAADFASALTAASQECDSCPTVSPSCFLREAVCTSGRCVRTIPPTVGVSLACQDARDAYMIDRGALLTAASTFVCHTDAECGIVVEANHCVNNCGTPLPAAATASYMESLQPDTDQCNAQCPPMPVVCPNGVPSCGNGRCQITPTGIGIP